MTGTSVLYMLLGAALVAVGVLASALADRIRGRRSTCETLRARTSRGEKSAAQRFAIPVVEPAELLPGTSPKRSPRPETKPTASTTSDDGEDVIAALIGAGYKKPIATDATWACTTAERATVEAWTAAALRRCVRRVAL